jgi:hypothetical protein
MSTVIPAVHRCVASHPPLLQAATSCPAVTDDTEGRAKRPHHGGRSLCTALVTATLLILGALSGASVAAEQNERASSLEWLLSRTTKPLEREALITAKDAEGRPIVGARIEVSVEMPSMPMMHKVPVSVAEPTAEPGTYRTRFTLEMAGEWAAQIEMKQPHRVKIIKKFKAD